MAKAKAISQSVSCGKQLKDVGGALTKEMNDFIAGAKELQDLLQTLPADLEANKFKEQGEKCKAAGKNKSIQECYELIYGPIPPPAKKDSDKSGGSSCCSTF